MLRKSLPWSVKQICNMISKQTISFNNPVQRAAGQWKDADKSLLIHSVLTMFIPDIYAIQVKFETEDGKKFNAYDIVDGKQRLTIISSFLADEWILTDLEPIKLESTGEEFNISGLKFSDLPEEVQEEIKGYSITIKAIELEEDDDEENIVNDIFYRLNNGKAVSREHLALVSAKRNVQEFAHRILTEHKLFTEIAHYAEGSIKKSDREMTILQSIVLVSGLEYTSFASKDIEAFFVNNDITEDTLTLTEQAFNSIALAFKDHSKFCTKINISAMVYMFTNVTDKTEGAYKLLRYASEAKKGDSYKRHCGAGCTKKDVVAKRINAIMMLCNTRPEVENVAR